ncbi:MAG: hypothetical protein ABID63_00075 [Pseudomonadota bacterium]
MQKKIVRIACYFIVILFCGSANAGIGWSGTFVNNYDHSITVYQAPGGWCWYKDDFDKTTTIPANSTVTIYSETMNSGECNSTVNDHWSINFYIAVPDAVLGGTLQIHRGWLPLDPTGSASASIGVNTESGPTNRSQSTGNQSCNFVQGSFSYEIDLREVSEEANFSISGFCQ